MPENIHNKSRKKKSSKEDTATLAAAKLAAATLLRLPQQSCENGCRSFNLAPFPSATDGDLRQLQYKICGLNKTSYIIVSSTSTKRKEGDGGKTDKK